MLPAAVAVLCVIIAAGLCFTLLRLRKQRRDEKCERELAEQAKRHRHKVDELSGL